jgi:hypothetical protein
MSGTMVVLVSGRGALAALAGVPSVQRHVRTARTLGLEPLLVFPPERHALGAEIRSLLGDDVACMAADDFARTPPQGPVLAVAAEWYLSLAALTAVKSHEGARAFGVLRERGFASVPVARIPIEQLVAVAGQLGERSASHALAALAQSARDTTEQVELDARSEQRLSDNVSTAHAEGKLVEQVFGARHLPPAFRLRPVLVPRLARLLHATDLDPAALSTAKLGLGLAAAWWIGAGGYAEGLAGALLYFAARLIGASGAVLARAGVAGDEARERLDFAGDTVLHFALLWGVAAGVGGGGSAVALAVVATLGILLSTGIAYVFVLKDSWSARRGVGPAPLSFPPGHDFVARFVRRDGIAYALLFAAVTGRLDLLLWAAAVSSHLFYILWLVGRPRRDAGPTMALGRPA